MKNERDKKNKNEYFVTVTMQFSLYFTNKEVEDGTEIPHEVIVVECAEMLANKEYEVQEDEA